MMDGLRGIVTCSSFIESVAKTIKEGAFSLVHPEECSFKAHLQQHVSSVNNS